MASEARAEKARKGHPLGHPWSADEIEAVLYNFGTPRGATDHDGVMREMQLKSPGEEITEWALEITIARAKDDLVLTRDGLAEMLGRYPQLSFDWDGSSGNGFNRPMNAQLFQWLDTDGDGVVTEVELQRWARMLPLTDSPASVVADVMQADKTNKGAISESDLYFACVNNQRLATLLELQVKLLDHMLDPPPWRTPPPPDPENEEEEGGGGGHDRWTESQERNKRGMSRAREKPPARSLDPDVKKKKKKFSKTRIVGGGGIFGSSTSDGLSRLAGRVSTLRTSFSSPLSHLSGSGGDYDNSNNGVESPRQNGARSSRLSFSSGLGGLFGHSNTTGGSGSTLGTAQEGEEGEDKEETPSSPRMLGQEEGRSKVPALTGVTNEDGEAMAESSTASSSDGDKASGKASSSSLASPTSALTNRLVSADNRPSLMRKSSWMGPLNSLKPMSSSSSSSSALAETGNKAWNSPLGIVSENMRKDDNSDSDDYELEELERGGPRGRSLSIERKCELRSQRDLIAFTALAKLALQRLDHAEEIRKQNESIMAGEIFSALDESEDGFVDFYELQHFLRTECKVYVTESELSLLHSFDLTKLRGKAFVKKVKDANTGEIREEYDVMASINADIESSIDTSFTPRALAKFLAVPSHHKVRFLACLLSLKMVHCISPFVHLCFFWLSCVVNFLMLHS